MSFSRWSRDLSQPGSKQTVIATKIVEQVKLAIADCLAKKAIN
ncbi:hypothetical protein [Hydrococcus rivularis]|nr:hypothetical protein [Hydrococcus rivularis]